MIDLRLLRSDLERVRASLELRGSKIDIDALVELEARCRELTASVEKDRAAHNEANRQIAQTAPDQRESAIAAARELAERFKGAEAQLQKAREELDAAAATMPNLVYPQAPPGSGDESNLLVRTVGEVKTFDFEGRDHLTIGESLDIIDVERAAKVSGSRFGMLKGKGALLEFALVRLVMDRLMAHGFIPVIPPVLVREEAMYGTGFFPTDEQQVYKTEADDLYLAGTAEVPLASMHGGETFDADKLPLRYAGFSTCFRREAGTYGKDTRGIIRLHQFDKVEMFSFCRAEHSDGEHLMLVGLEESIFQALEIPYRVIEICAGDLADPNYRKFDIEAWLPGTQRWLEVTSCSNDIDYQARRLGIRAKGATGAEFVHTLNGTAVAVQRTIVAILENHQQADGSVLLPAALRPYTGFDSL
ncbi:MAG TPA: serine--tRNA ligase [Actinomycetota bacterium]|nr:serine--tRNA ligase [Actinomycetota bacterium]